MHHGHGSDEKGRGGTGGGEIGVSVGGGHSGHGGHEGKGPASPIVWRPKPPTYRPLGCCCLSTSGTRILLAVGFLVFTIAAITVPLVIHKKIQDGVKSRLVITGPDSEGYAGWQDSRSDESGKTVFKTYVWHVTNPNEVVLQKARPYLVQKGPYVYDKIDIKFDITFVNHTWIKFKSYTYYVFNKDKSNGLDDSELVTSLNVPFQAMMQNYDRKKFEDIANGLPDVFMAFTTKTAREMVFGYHDFFLSQANTTYPGLQPNMSSIADSDIYGYDMVYSGESDYSKVQQYYMWRNYTQIMVCSIGVCQPKDLVEMWNNHDDSRVPAATLGRQFHSNVEAGSCVESWVPQTFRRFTLCNKNSETVTLNGIELLRFTIDDHTYQNSTLWPDNSRWRQDGPTGLCNVSRAQHGMPVYMSKAHFYGADPSTYAAFDGDIKPEFLKHDTLVHVQPDLGTTMNGQKRIQVNWQVGPVYLASKKKTIMSNLPSTLWPVAWFEESGSISPYLTDKFKNNIQIGQRISRYFAWIGGFSALCCIFGIWYTYHERKTYEAKYGPISPSSAAPGSFHEQLRSPVGV